MKSQYRTYYIYTRFWNLPSMFYPPYSRDTDFGGLRQTTIRVDPVRVNIIILYTCNTFMHTDYVFRVQYCWAYCNIIVRHSINHIDQWLSTFSRSRTSDETLLDITETPLPIFFRILSFYISYYHNKNCNNFL